MSTTRLIWRRICGTEKSQKKRKGRMDQMTSAPPEVHELVSRQGNAARAGICYAIVIA
jgi:hypothetical protein